MKHSQITILLLSVITMALNLTAQNNVRACKSTISFDMSTIKDLEVGNRTEYMPVTLTRDDDATDFTNLQFTLILPESLEGTACNVADDTKIWSDDDGEYVQVLAWSSNFLPELKEFRTVASNLNKIAITKNPLTLCRIKLRKNAELAQGAQIKVMDLKYTSFQGVKYVYTPEGCDPNDDGHTFTVTTPSGSPYIPGYEPVSSITGDLNNDGLVDVQDFSAIVNMILGKTSTSIYNADLNKNGVVDINDLNIIINILLGK